MTDSINYAVFLYLQALEVVGDALKPYLRDAPGGPHIVCSEIDSSGPLFGMTLDGKGSHGEVLELEIMVPVSMVKMVMSMHGEHEIEFV